MTCRCADFCEAVKGWGKGGNFQRHSAAKVANEFCRHVVDLCIIATVFDFQTGLPF